MSNQFEKYILDVAGGLKKVIVTDKEGNEIDSQKGLELWVDEVKKIRDEYNGCFFFCGNGASATMAEHFSHDFFQNAKVRTDTCSEIAHITAISNDISYDDVFSYRIGRLAKQGDMLVTISSSGNSPNIIKAINTARYKKTFIVTLSGKKCNNKSKQLGDLNFYVPLDTYGMVESAHSVLLHCWLDLFLDKYEGGRH